MNEYESLKEEILAILQEHGKALLGQFTGDFERFAKDIATEATKYAAEAIANPSDEHARQNLRHLKAQALMLAGIWRVEAESAAWAIFDRIVEIIFRIAVKALLAAAGGAA